MVLKTVSILMPIYNGIEFISESVQSIINQTFTNWELIIGINGHPVNSDVYQTALNFTDALNDKRIKVIDYPECKGKAHTLNTMLATCEANYVALLDVDDCWLIDKLKKQEPFIQKDYDVIGTKCFYFGEGQGIPNIPTGDISDFNFLQGNPIINSSSIIKKDLAYWDKDVWGIEDYDLWLRLWRQKRRFYNCPELLVAHRIHRASAFNAQGNDKNVEALRLKYAKEK